MRRSGSSVMTLFGRRVDVLSDYCRNTHWVVIEVSRKLFSRQTKRFNADVAVMEFGQNRLIVGVRLGSERMNSIVCKKGTDQGV